MLRTRYRPCLEALETRLAPATFTWTGRGGNALWSNAANWTVDQGPPRAPAGDNDEELVFPPGVGQRLTENDIVRPNNRPTLFKNITVSHGIGYTLAGSRKMAVTDRILFTDPAATPAAVHVVSLPLLNEVNLTIRVEAGQVRLTGGLELVDRSRQFFDVSTRGELRAESPIVGDGGIRKDGPGRLVLASNANSYQGAPNDASTFVVAGVLRVEATGGAIPDTSIVNLFAGTLDLGNNDERIGLLYGGGNVILGSATLTTGGGDSNIEFDFRGILSGTGGLTKIGPLALKLVGNNTYTGLTRVLGGLLIVNGFQPASPVFIGDGATLKGGGTVGDVIVAPGGTLSPGDISGTLTTGRVTFQRGATFRTEIRASTPDRPFTVSQLASGPVSLDGSRLQVSLTLPAAVGDAFMVITGPVTGTFDGLPQGTPVSAGDRLLRVSYTGSVVLQRIKLPPTVALTASVNSSAVGQPVVFTARLTSGGYGGGALAFRGSISFLVDGVESLRTNVSNNGQAEFATAALAVGQRQVRAVYTGDENFFDAASTPLSQPVTPCAGPCPDTERFIRRTYSDLLGRAVDQPGLQGWTARLNAGLSRNALTRLLVGSIESRERIVTGMYQKYLSRLPDRDGLRAWSNYLGQEGSTEIELRVFLVGSNEYRDRRGGGTYEGFLRAVYRDVLGRDPEDGVIPRWGLPSLEPANRARIAGAFFKSREFLRTLVSSYYRQYLNRGPDDAGLNAWVEWLARPESEASIIAAFVGSNEYFARP